MRSKRHSRKTSKKFARFIKFILKALGKARDFYVKSLGKCASRINYGHDTNHSPEEYYELPMRFSESSSAASNVEDEEELMKLIRAASVRSTTDDDDDNEMNMFSPKRLRMKMKSRGLPKNMGRIDEDRPCEFEENDVEVDFLVAGKRNKSGIIKSKN